MLKKFESFARNIMDAVAQSSFDPASLNDPVALATEWRSLRRGGSNFRTHKLLTVSAERMEFKSSRGAISTYTILILMSIVPAMVFLSAWHNGQQPFSSFDGIFPLLLSGVFLAFGIVVLRKSTAPIVFDKKQGFFWKGRVAPNETFNKSEIKNCTTLDQIYALQLLREYIRTNKTSYYSYELNLVLKDGKRINVVDHGNITKLREDAAGLAAFLGCPVWDAA